MKKIISILVTSMLTLGLVGCGSQSPKNTVKNYFENLKKGNFQNVETLLGENASESGENNQSSEEINKKLAELIKKTTYKINSEEINGDSATVNVKVNGPDIGSIIGKYMQESISIALSQAFSGTSLSQEEEQSMYDDILLRYLNEVAYTDRTQDIKLTKKDGQWVIVEDNSLVKLVYNIDPLIFGKNLNN